MDNNNFNNENNGFEYIFNPYEEPPHIATEEELKSVKTVYNKVHLSLFVFMAVMYASVFILIPIARQIIPDSWLQNRTLVAFLNLMINDIPQYLIAFPIFYFMVRNVKKSYNVTKNRLSVSEFLSYLLIGFTLMNIGAVIGNIFNSVIGSFFQKIPDNPIDELIESTPIWLLIIFVVIIGPIFEELVFRKLLIDRLCICGDKKAILYSALAFAIFHCNLYQFFYAFFVGIVFGYIYTKTRDIKYSIIFHAIYNFFGSVIPILMMEQMKVLHNITEGIEQFTPQIIFAFISIAFLSVLQFAISIGGLICLVLALSRHTLFVSEKCEVKLPQIRGNEYCYNNVGFILFYVLCFGLTIFNLISQMLA